MLANVVKYSGLNAKIKALETRLLKYDDFYSLANQPDVGAFAVKLSEKTSYSTIIKELLTYNLGTRIPIERNLDKSIYIDFTSVYSFITDVKEKKFLKIIFLKYEIQIMKTLLRRIFDESENQNDIPTYESLLVKHFTINMEKLASSKTLREFIDNLKGTEFYKVLEKINLEDNSLFEFEQSLDLFYYLKMWKHQHKYLSSKNKKILERINGADIDLNNIMHIYRYKRFYEVDKSILYTYLLPVNFKIKKRQIEALIDSKSDFEFLEILSTTPYKNVFSNLNTGNLELDYYTYMLKLYNEEENKNPFSIVPAVSYFYKKSQEISNLTTLIEYVRYERDPDDSMKKLSIEPKKAVL